MPENKAEKNMESYRGELVSVWKGTVEEARESRGALGRARQPGKRSSTKMG